jgi:hypothetical protein
LTRAGDVGRAPSERAVRFGDEAARTGGGPAAAERASREARATPGGGRGAITDRADRWRRGNAQRLLGWSTRRHGASRVPGRPSDRPGSSDPVPSADSDASDRAGETGFATWIGNISRDRGGVREHGPNAEYVDVAGGTRHNRTASARGRPRRASPPRDRARMEGVRAGRQAHEGRRATLVTNHHHGAHRMVRCGNTLKVPLEREKATRGGGKRPAAAAALEKRRPEGPIPPAPSADPGGHPTPLLTNGFNPVRTHQPREISPRRHVPIQAFDG